MTAIESAVWGAVLVSGASTVVWAVLFVRTARANGGEKRASVWAMPVVGVLASIGTLASALGFGVQQGVLTFVLSQDTLTLVASMGRGALLMGGIIALAYYHPPDAG